jgi:glycerophosphoryl diester phosphodiesterase
VKYFPDRPIFCDKTNILAHKGGGSFDEGNTLEACKYGLALFDGIECDIQRSSDNKLWLSHSPNISSCGSFNSTCFASLTSNSIIQIDSCLGNNINYTQLETIFDYMSRNYPDKYISLDVKAWTPCGISGANITKQMNEMAREIISLTVQYHMENKVMVESETGDFLYYLKTHTNFIETYLTAFGDFELGFSRALDAGFSGISFKYNFKETIGKEHIDLLHRKGLKIQVWTVNDIDEVLLLKPDFIQTDNVGYNMNSSNL